MHVQIAQDIDLVGYNLNTMGNLTKLPVMSGVL